MSKELDTMTPPDALSTSRTGFILVAVIADQGDKAAERLALSPSPHILSVTPHFGLGGPGSTGSHGCFSALLYFSASLLS